jgi:hypothetical protein
MNKEIQIKFKIAVILQRPENSLLDQSQKLTDIYEVFKEELILSGVSKRFTENKMDDAYDKGYNDGYATGSTIM